MIREVVSRPSQTIMITRVATFSRFCITFVVTEVICPSDFSLKYPIGRYRICSAISTRFLAQVS